MKNKAIKGVYTITNDVTGEIYVGCSKDIIKRWISHTSTLEKCTHSNKCLQISWDNHNPSDFSFKILEECENHEERESYYISLIGTYNNCKEKFYKYNIENVIGKGYRLKELIDEGIVVAEYINIFEDSNIYTERTFWGNFIDVLKIEKFLEDDWNYHITTSYLMKK